MKFTGVEMQGTDIISLPTSGDLPLHFSRTKLTEVDISVVVPFVSCFVSETVLTDPKTHFNGNFLWFDSRDTVYRNSGFDINADISHFHFQNTQFIQLDLKVSTNTFSAVFQNISLVQSSLKITAMRMSVAMTNSIVTHGGLVFVKSVSNLSSSWVQISIMNCTFQNNRKMQGSGGAVEVIYLAPVISEASNSFMEIVHSNFINNSAQGEDVFEFFLGGAISVQSQFDLEDNHCHVLHVQIENCSFVDNQARDGGGSMSVSGKCIDTQISGCLFGITNPVYDSDGGIFISSTWDISIEKSTFTTKATQVSSALIQLETGSPRAEIWHLHMIVRCSPWSKVQEVAAFDALQFTKQLFLRKISLSCTWCAPTFYLPSNGNFTVYSWGNQNVSVHDSSGISNRDLQCMKCPAGGECPGDGISSKSNFFGI